MHEKPVKFGNWTSAINANNRIALSWACWHYLRPLGVDEISGRQANSQSGQHTDDMICFLFAAHLSKYLRFSQPCRQVPIQPGGWTGCWFFLGFFEDAIILQAWGNGKKRNLAHANLQVQQRDHRSAEAFSCLECRTLTMYAISMGQRKLKTGSGTCNSLAQYHSVVN